MNISTNSSIRHELYRRELLRYIGSMTIKFSPFAEMMGRQAEDIIARPLENYLENPYYRNLVGEYSWLEWNTQTKSIDKMMIYSIEEDGMIPFEKSIWDTHPQTAELYSYGSEAYNRLCLSYPDKVGLIKSICYPVLSIEEAFNAPELTIIRHEPGFLRSNEQESLYQAAQNCLSYVRDRWFIYDYGHEDQYYVVFMTQLYLCLFEALLKQRIDNQDTAAVHSMHVWDRLEANGLELYESILTDEQARWFYRNMSYLKENRGRKSNLILLAENLLKNLKVHLVGKKIFQQTFDNEQCITVPEFLNEEIVDYSVQIAESLDPGSSQLEEIQNSFNVERKQTSSSMLSLVDLNTKESMDYILHRVYGEGYYPDYSVNNSAEKEYLFGRTTANIVPTRLLELQKYAVYAIHERKMLAFLYDSLQLHAALGKLSYKINFIDENTGVEVSLSVNDAMALLHYACYKRYDITPLYLPNRSVIECAYKLVRPKNSELLQYFNWNNFKYSIDTIVDTKTLLSDIPWSNGRIFTLVSSFMQLLGRQFDVLVEHERSCYIDNHTTYQWALYYYYQDLLDKRVISIRKDMTYHAWLEADENLKALTDAYDKLTDRKEGYNSLCDYLLERLLPIQLSEALSKYAGTLFDNTKYYTMLKNLFQEWTSHDLTYLDTDRSDIVYINMMPMPVMTEKHNEEYNRDIIGVGPGVSTYYKQIDVVDFDRNPNIPILVEVDNTEEDESIYQYNQTSKIKLELAKDIEDTPKAFYDTVTLLTTQEDPVDEEVISFDSRNLNLSIINLTQASELIED